MNQLNYQSQTLVGATGVELIVALYDGAIRFLYRAIHATESNDVKARREAVKRFVDIIMYLQARLRTDLGQDTAATLSDFYAAMFTMSLEASHAASIPQFHEVIANVRNVRDAWLVVARDPAAGRVLPRELRTREERYTRPAPPITEQPESIVYNWSADLPVLLSRGISRRLAANMFQCCGRQ